jgi:acyl dehydratase
MRFADLHAGQVIETGTATLTEAEIVAFARDYDPQWFHTDAERARKGPFGGLIASGWQTCGIAMRLAAQTVLDGSESFASPGLEQIRWPAPVRAGDVLRLRIEVRETGRSQTREHLGILRWRWNLYNQRDELVLDLVATSLFDLSGRLPPP